MLVGVRQGIELGKGCRPAESTIGRILWASRNPDLRVETTIGIKPVRRIYLEYKATVQLRETSRYDLLRGGAFYSVTGPSESAETVGVHTRLTDCPPGCARVALMPPCTVA